MVLPDHFYPYWSVYDKLGEKYCDCSHEKYAITTLELHEGELPGQRGLPKVKERLPFEPEFEELPQSNLHKI